jgi:HSP20 family protein
MIYPDIKTFRENIHDHFISPWINRPHFLGKNALEVRWNKGKPAANIKKEGALFELEIAIPGFSKEEISITVKDDILTVKAEKEHLTEEETSEYILREFEADKMERQFRLAEGLGKEGIRAHLEHGILKLTFVDVPVEKERPAKLIDIE